MSQGKHCHVDLEASLKDLEIDKHPLPFQACGGDGVPRREEVGGGMVRASLPVGSWQAPTHFFIRLQLHLFGLDVRLILTGDTDFIVKDDARRTGDALLKFSTSGSGKRRRLVIWILSLLCC